MSDEIDVSLEKVSAKIIVFALNASNIAFYTHHFQNKYQFILLPRAKILIEKRLCSLFKKYNDAN